MEELDRETPALRVHPLFAGMDDGALRNALETLKAESTEYHRGAVVHAPGTPMERFGLVLSGMVQVCVDDIEGNRMIMAEVLPGVSFGESLCFLRTKDSPVYAFAAEDSRLLWLSADALLSEPENRACSDLQRRFTAALAAKNLSMNNRIQVLSKLSLREKLTAWFTELAAAQGSDTVRLPMNREDTAAWIGANRSALSRELARMKKEGLIDYRRETIKLFIT